MEKNQSFASHQKYKNKAIENMIKRMRMRQEASKLENLQRVLQEEKTEKKDLKEMPGIQSNPPYYNQNKFLSTTSYPPIGGHTYRKEEKRINTPPPSILPLSSFAFSKPHMEKEISISPSMQNNNIMPKNGLTQPKIPPIRGNRNALPSYLSHLKVKNYKHISQKIFHKKEESYDEQRNLSSENDKDVSVLKRELKTERDIPLNPNYEKRSEKRIEKKHRIPPPPRFPPEQKRHINDKEELERRIRETERLFPQPHREQKNTSSQYREEVGIRTGIIRNRERNRMQDSLQGSYTTRSLPYKRERQSSLSPNISYREEEPFSKNHYEEKQMPSSYLESIEEENWSRKNVIGKKHLPERRLPSPPILPPQPSLQSKLNYNTSSPYRERKKGFISRGIRYQSHYEFLNQKLKEKLQEKLETYRTYEERKDFPHESFVNNNETSPSFFHQTREQELQEPSLPSYERGKEERDFQESVVPSRSRNKSEIYPSSPFREEVKDLLLFEMESDFLPGEESIERDPEVRNAELLETLQFIIETDPIKWEVIRILSDGNLHSEHEILRKIKKIRYMGSVALGMILYNLIEVVGKDMIEKTRIMDTIFYKINERFKDLIMQVQSSPDNNSSESMDNED